MDSDSLRKLQLIELKILLEIKRVCETNNIKYFLIGGTLLGAVRHNGFIPWDDDIDIGMMRDEYKRFLEVFPLSKGDEYTLETTETDSGHAYLYGKVRLSGTTFQEERNKNVLENQGIWVDVFPFDNIPNSRVKQSLHKLIFSFFEVSTLRKYKYYDGKPKTVKGNIFNYICICLSKFAGRDSLLSNREKIIQKYNSESTEYIINWPFKAAKREYFNELTELPFETVLFPVPKMYHEYLTSFYGDYMRIPPENERPKHRPYEPDFGKYAYIKTLDDVLPKKE